MNEWRKKIIASKIILIKTKHLEIYYYSLWMPPLAGMNLMNKEKNNWIKFKFFKLFRSIYGLTMKWWFWFNNKCDKWCSHASRAAFPQIFFYVQLQRDDESSFTRKMWTKKNNGRIRNGLENVYEYLWIGNSKWNNYSD